VYRYSGWIDEPIVVHSSILAKWIHNFGSSLPQNASPLQRDFFRGCLEGHNPVFHSALGEISVLASAALRSCHRQLKGTKGVGWRACRSSVIIPEELCPWKFAPAKRQYDYRTLFPGMPETAWWSCTNCRWGGGGFGSCNVLSVVAASPVTGFAIDCRTC